jgi:hypothetical protein
MRPVLLFAAVAGALVLGLPACGIDQLMQQGSSGGPEASDAGDAGGEGGITGAGCGSERQTGITLCAVTSMCPEVVVDTQALPSCGFRIRGTSVDLVCGCGEYVCPMGVFATCAQAVQLLTSQTEAQVCAQIGEGRCTDVSGSAGTSSTSSSGGGSSSGGIGCDRQCLQECGGGEACASVCNCQ